jgi:glucose/arabinose dehydrogenase
MSRRARFLQGLVIAVLVFAAMSLAKAAGAFGAVALQSIGTFDQPVFVGAPPADTSRVFVVEKGGRVIDVRNGVASTFLDITSRVRSSGNEQGLLSIAFPPDYASSGIFYVYYTAQPPGGSGAPGSDLTISAFRRVDDDHADPASERVVLTIPHRRYDNHNGGQLQFGPDGMLWIGTGDGGDANDSLGNAQQTDPSWNDAAAEHDARLGKLLRIDPRPGDGCGGSCTIPAGNPPFAEREIWAYGLRNPWRFSFDRSTGDLVIGDVGQDTWEEVDFASAAAGRLAGANYGWNTYEADHPRGSTASAGAVAGVTMPVIEKAHAAPDSFSSIAGGYVVRDPALPSLLGRYVYADTYRGDIRAATPGVWSDDAATGLHVSTLASFGEDACGRVYAVSLDGPVDRLSESGACVPPATAPGSVTPTPAPGGGSTGTMTPTNTRTVPLLSITAASRQHPWKTGFVRVRATCSANCHVRGYGVFRISGSRRAPETSRISVHLRAHRTTTLRLRIPARTRRILLTLLRHHTISIRFALRATDAKGHTRSAQGTTRSTLAR